MLIEKLIKENKVKVFYSINMSLRYVIGFSGVFYNDKVQVQYIKYSDSLTMSFFNRQDLNQFEYFKSKRDAIRRIKDGKHKIHGTKYYKVPQNIAKKYFTSYYVFVIAEVY